VPARASIRLRIIRKVSVLALVVFLLADLGLNSLIGKAKEPAPVFRPALKQIQPQARVPILLPSKLPSPISERDIKLAWGTVSDDGYFISLYYEEIGTNASYAAGFGGSISERYVLGGGGIVLAGGRRGTFMPVSCGGSCAPANLWWEENGVTYQIQIKLSSTLKVKDQQRILFQMANSVVTVRRE